MATLDFDSKITRIKVIDDRDTHYYNNYIDGYYKKIKEIFDDYNIVLSSDYKVDFMDNNYKIKPNPGFFGAISCSVFYNDTLIAEGYISGSNFCDQEGRLTIYMNKLKSVYGKSQTC